MNRQAVTGPSTGADRLNRAGLSLLGLLLLAAGAYGLARGWGAFGDGAASESLLSDTWSRSVVRNGSWFGPVAAVVSLLLALLGLRWLRAQLRAATPPGVDLTHRGDDGTTLVRPAGAAQALADDIETYRGVAGAAARVSGDPEAPEIDLRVAVVEGCNLPRLRTRIEQEALARFQQALELETLEANVEFRVTVPEATRV
ncbi:MAG: alkaline shock response membrane anchor protein AmaP [Acidimicrobiia bacterium]